MSSIIQIQWTCASIEEARAISRQLIEIKLVACANIHPSIESMYMWEGSLEVQNEVKVVFKTTENHFEDVRKFISDHCEYEIPGIIALGIEKSNLDFEKWVVKNVR